MGFSYHFTLSAPATVASETLERFLKSVEAEAKKMGFNPTMVLNATFDTQKRREFARRLTTGLFVKDSRLACVVVLRDGQVWAHESLEGSCRVIPNQGVILVLTDEKKFETCFGFMKYPDSVLDINGKSRAETHLAGRWFFRDFIDSPDKRFRDIIRLFANSGFVEAEIDEFAG